MLWCFVRFASFFFFKQKTAYEVRISDWSSDVCSSDLLFRLAYRQGRVRAAVQPIIDALGGIAVAGVIVYGGFRVIEGVTTPGAFFSFIAAVLMAYQPLRGLGTVNTTLQEIGRASGRERVCQDG